LDINGLQNYLEMNFQSPKFNRTSSGSTPVSPFGGMFSPKSKARMGIISPPSILRKRKRNGATGAGSPPNAQEIFQTPKKSPGIIIPNGTFPVQSPSPSSQIPFSPSTFLNTLSVDGFFSPTSKVSPRMTPQFSVPLPHISDPHEGLSPISRTPPQSFSEFSNRPTFQLPPDSHTAASPVLTTSLSTPTSVSIPPPLSAVTASATSPNLPTSPFLGLRPNPISLNDPLQSPPPIEISGVLGTNNAHLTTNNNDNNAHTTHNTSSSNNNNTSTNNNNNNNSDTNNNNSYQQDQSHTTNNNNNTYNNTNNGNNHTTTSTTTTTTTTHTNGAFAQPAPFTHMNGDAHSLSSSSGMEEGSQILYGLVSSQQDDKSRVQGVQVKNTYDLAPCQPTLSQQLNAINSRINRPTFTPSLSLTFAHPPPPMSLPYPQSLPTELSAAEAMPPPAMMDTTSHHTTAPTTTDTHMFDSTHTNTSSSSTKTHTTTNNHADAHGHDASDPFDLSSKAIAISRAKQVARQLYKEEDGEDKSMQTIKLLRQTEERKSLLIQAEELLRRTSTNVSNPIIVTNASTNHPVPPPPTHNGLLDDPTFPPSLPTNTTSSSSSSSSSSNNNNNNHASSFTNYLAHGAAHPPRSAASAQATELAMDDQVRLMKEQQRIIMDSYEQNGNLQAPTFPSPPPPLP
jgi:hypothetical protein